MITYNLRVYAFTILGLAFVTFALIFVFNQDLENVQYDQVWSQISTTISINAIIWLVFVKWIWKWRLFYPWLVPYPNLEGKWSGQLLSTYDDPNGEEIATEISIHQTFFNIQVKIKTGESRSHSISARFDIDKDRGFERLIYSYMNTPNADVRERSEIHHGTTMLNFEGFKVDNLEGNYWTDRKTTGTIAVSKTK